MGHASQWVLIKRFAEITGYSENAVRHKVKNGTWIEGRLWRKAPDGRIFVNVAEFERWVESETHVTGF
ncbi:excisionase [Pseudorhodoferax sp.]|uniref:excisionase n=1 Tax=Pseudorhodoferax sp. TaxID=1993553 RepID=UPI002DD66E1F|nr:excisionase [Pseudorhodoferax sp.]